MINNNNIAKELSKIAKTLLGYEFDTKEEMEKYFKDHPKADKANHWVKKQETKKMQEVKNKQNSNDKLELSDQIKSDVSDALDHAQDFLGRKTSINEYDVTVKDDMNLNDILENDDISSWGEWKNGELAKMSDEELHDELTGFRGDDFADRTMNYKKTGKWPHVVVVEHPDEDQDKSFYGVGDGRGRLSVAYGLGIKSLPAIVLKRKENKNV